MVFCFFLSQWGECQGRNRKDRNFKILYIWAHFREPLSSTAWGSRFPSGSSNRGHFSTGGSPPASQRCLTVASATFTKCVPGSHHPRRRRGEGSAASKHRCTAQLPLHAALGPLQTPWLSCPLAGVSQEDGPFPRVTLTGHSSGAQFTGSLCSLLCWGLLLNSSSLDPPWGGPPVTMDFRLSNMVTMASFPVSLPKTLQLRFSSQVDCTHCCHYGSIILSKSFCWLLLGF